MMFTINVAFLRGIILVPYKECLSALWVLMAWWFSTRVSIARVLGSNPCVSSCLWLIQASFDTCHHLGCTSRVPTCDLMKSYILTIYSVRVVSVDLCLLWILHSELYTRDMPKKEFVQQYSEHIYIHTVSHLFNSLFGKCGCSVKINCWFPRHSV